MTRSKLGPFVKCPHPEMIETIALAGFDFAVVDMEHTPLGPRDIYPLVLAAENRGLDLIVRIPLKDEAWFKWCRDLNVRAIQVPFVESAADVRQAVEHALFGPQGKRGLCRFTRAADFSAKDGARYIAEANADLQLVLQVEGKKGVDNIDEILEAAPQNSILFIGPYDLSQSLGKPGLIWDAQVVEAIEKIVSKCATKGIGTGIFTDTAAGVTFWAQRGMTLIEYGSDLNLFLSAAKSLRDSAGLG